MSPSLHITTHVDIIAVARTMCKRIAFKLYVQKYNKVVTLVKVPSKVTPQIQS